MSAENGGEMRVSIKYYHEKKEVPNGKHSSKHLLHCIENFHLNTLV